MSENLNSGQLKALDLIKKGYNVFLTGAAGVGKSHLVRHIIDNFEGFHITSSTGISAVNIGGKTIHSWASLGFAEGTKEQLWGVISKRKHAVIKIRRCRKLIIDEISMIDGELFNKLDYILKKAKNNNRPFGGIQVVLVGDGLQLPFIQKQGESKHFFFESDAYKNGSFRGVELKEVVRQSNKEFINALHEIRMGEHGLSTIKLINSRIGKLPEKNIRAVHLMTHNAQVDRINLEELKKIKTSSAHYSWSTEGEDAAIKILEKGCPATKDLELKVGAQVICVYNLYPDKEIVNGSVGVVSNLTASPWPIVRFNNGEEQIIKPATWEIKEFRGDKLQTIATLEQVPLKLGWAQSVHRSQGSTLDHAIVNLKNCFETGQAYTALSRVKSLDGLYLEAIDWGKVIAHPKAVEFYKKINK
jgi:ATP-dependent DNA helicase PIF1